VPPLSSRVVNTIWSPRPVPSKFCSVVRASTRNAVASPGADRRAAGACPWRLLTDLSAWSGASAALPRYRELQGGTWVASRLPLKLEARQR
jgi:hypothetical protein